MEIGANINYLNGGGGAANKCCVYIVDEAKFLLTWNKHRDRDQAQRAQHSLLSSTGKQRRPKEAEEENVCKKLFSTSSFSERKKKK
jgi:hypothetical protein